VPVVPPEPVVVPDELPPVPVVVPVVPVPLVPPPLVVLVVFVVPPVEDPVVDPVDVPLAGSVPVVEEVAPAPGSVVESAPIDAGVVVVSAGGVVLGVVVPEPAVLVAGGVEDAGGV
jgi:hypothetical protein